MEQRDDSLELLKTERMAALLQTDTQTIRKLCREKKLPAVKLGRDWYMRRDAFEALFPRVVIAEVTLHPVNDVSELIAV